MSPSQPNRPILAHRPTAGPRAGRRRSGALGIGLALLVAGAAAFAIAPDNEPFDPGPVIARALPLPALDPVAPPAPLWREERVQRGDTIGILLARAGVADAAAIAYLSRDPAARSLYQLRIGQAVRVALDDDGRLEALRVPGAKGEVLAVGRDGGGFRAEVVAPPLEVRHEMRSGEIRTSLFAAADDAGLPDSVTRALAEVFGSDVDFLRDVRRGDRFTVIYETRAVEGEPVGTGRILAAEYVASGTPLRAFLWTHPDGTEGYYAEDGTNRRQAFLRSPMEFSRVTSGFSLARLHPILQTWRAHRGIDYAAPVGTPVRATGDGVVTFAGAQGGYGNVVFLRHDATYSTVYGHLSAFAPRLRAGTRVRQGETIGFVGATGWATGPHLHYEFRIAGEARDPLRIALPAAVPLEPAEREPFLASARDLSRQVALARALPAGALAALD